MKISGHATEAIFERYNITDEDDIDAAGAKIVAFQDGQMDTPAPAPRKESRREPAQVN